jgi:hypothetical protein
VAMDAVEIRRRRALIMIVIIDKLKLKVSNFIQVYGREVCHFRDC